MMTCGIVPRRECPGKRMRRSSSVLAAAAFLASTQYAMGGSTEAPVWSDVSLIFTERCVMCHSEHGAELDLRLDSYESALAGSRKGPVLVAGDAEHSEMVRRLRGVSKPRMPFLSRPLSEDELNVIVRWIDAGLPKGDD